MDYDWYWKYHKQFGYVIVYDYCCSEEILASPDRKSYSLDEATDEELDALIKESVISGRNMLLEKFRDKEITVVPKPDVDY